ncbi:MAG: hypothetical protein ABJL55_19515 [Roseibium sp.]
MARFTIKIDETHICMIGFLSCAISGTSLVRSLTNDVSELMQIEKLSDYADATSRSSPHAKSLIAYKVEVFE